MEPIAPGLWTDEPEPRPLGGRAPDGRIAAPCPPGWKPVALARAGTVWAHTVQRFRPKSPPYAGPEAFEPFILAYIALPEVTMAARLAGVAPEDVRAGLPVVFAPAPLAPGDRRFVPAFRPA